MERNFTLEQIRGENPVRVDGGVYDVTLDDERLGRLAAGFIVNILQRMPEEGFNRRRVSWKPQWGYPEYWVTEEKLQPLVDMGLLVKDNDEYTFTEQARNVLFSYHDQRFPRIRH